jgi:hypothetical protein
MIKMSLSRTDDGLWLFVSDLPLQGLFNLGHGLRADGSETLAVQLLRSAIEDRAAQHDAPVAATQPRLIGWRTADYTAETADSDTARNWSSNVTVLPIFEGDPNTKLTPSKEPNV